MILYDGLCKIVVSLLIGKYTKDSRCTCAVVAVAGL